jgi:BlaI family penicillinase repressor
MNRLTPAEEQVMLRLWKLEKASVKEIVELYRDLKQVPAYNTTSTIIRILEKKKFVKHKAKGRGYIYLPKISKEEYGVYLINYLLTNYFDEDKSILIQKMNEIL